MSVKIVINDTVIPLAPGQRVVRNFESNLLNREPEVTEFTYPFKILLTDEAIKALGYLHVLEIPDFPVSFSGRLVLHEVFVRDVTVNVLKVYTEMRTADINVVGDYGSYREVVGDKKLADLVLGGTRTIGTVNTTVSEATSIPDGIASRLLRYFKCDADVYMNQLANNTVVDDYLFPMCVDVGENTIDASGRDEPKAIFNAYYADHVGGANQYVDPYEANIALWFKSPLVGTGVTLANMYYWVPMFRLVFVLKKCFTEFGFTFASGTPLDGLDFQNILLYNSFAINSAAVSESIPGPTLYQCNIIATGVHIYPQDHMPDMTIIDFLHEVGKKYNIQWDIDFTARTVTPRVLNQFPAQSPVVDITNKSSKFSVINNTQTEAKWKNGFLLKHDYDAGDATALDKEYMDSVASTGWQHVFDSYFAMLSSSPAEGDKAYVRSENNIYQFYNSAWEFFSHHIGAYPSTASTKLEEITTMVTPITMRMHPILYLPDEQSMATFADSSISYFQVDVLCPTTHYGVCGRGLLQMANWAEIKAAGGPISNSLGGNTAVDIPKISWMPRVMNWLYRQNMIRGASHDMPFASPGRYDVNGNLVGPNAYHQMWYVWNEQKGTYYDWWKLWDDMLRNGMPVDIELTLTDINFYMTLKWNVIRVRRGQLNYLLIKTTEEYPLPSVALLEAYLLK